MSPLQNGFTQHETFFREPKGSAWSASKQRSRDRKAAEESVMSEVRGLDENRCRVPRCAFMRQKPVIDVCHMTHRGAGGNPDLSRTTKETLFCACRPHHGLYDAGLLDAIPENEADGSRGPMSWYRRKHQTEPWEHFATEKQFGVSTERTER